MVGPRATQGTANGEERRGSPSWTADNHRSFHLADSDANSTCCHRPPGGFRGAGPGSSRSSSRSSSQTPSFSFDKNDRWVIYRSATAGCYRAPFFSLVFFFIFGSSVLKGTNTRRCRPVRLKSRVSVALTRLLMIIYRVSTHVARPFRHSLPRGLVLKPGGRVTLWAGSFFFAS